jgi:hypothetical protein
VPALLSAPRAAAALRLLVVVAACGLGVLSAVALLSPPNSSPAVAASSTMHPLESMFQDDRELIYSPTTTVIRALNALQALGVDRLRITVLWSAIAPGAGSRLRPAHFRAFDPAAYPSGAWAPYDRVLELARARGIAVDFDLTAPGPLWAMRSRAPAARQADHYEPSASEFGRFVLAVGRRYTGDYRAPGAVAPIPRVDYWSIWNEPNQPGWLAPQRRMADGISAIESARLYRGYVDAAFAALRRSGHRSDTILIGELAPEGEERSGLSSPVPPIPFLDALYCVAADHRPLSGAPARALGCPGARAPTGFVTAHPGLFGATGFAHHPYSFFLPPAAGMSDPNFAPLSELSRLERGLDEIFATYSVARRLPLYLTEYGYETDPPNPFRGVSPSLQAAYLDQAAYLAWRDPRVRTLSQFLLVDSPPDRAYPRGSVRYWSTFQTGLVYLRGVPKPAFYTYALPIYVPRPQFARGDGVEVWGMLRAARNHTRQQARIQWRATGGSAWRTLLVLSTRDPTGALEARVSPPGTGLVRIAWTAPSGLVLGSRQVAVRVAGG